MLKDQDMSKDVDLVRISKLTEGFSSSDLKEICRHAAMNRLNECLNNSTESSTDNNFVAIGDRRESLSFIVMMDEFEIEENKVDVFKNLERKISESMHLRPYKMSDFLEAVQCSRVT